MGRDAIAATVFSISLGCVGPTPRGATTTSSAPHVDSPAPSLLLQPGVVAQHVAGRVMFEGAPVAGATVRVYSTQPQRGELPPLRVVTNHDGAFDLGVIPASVVQLVAEASGKTAAIAQLNLSDPTLDPPSTRRELVLTPCTFRLWGRVSDTAGRAIAHARVHYDDFGSGHDGVAAETDAHGDYSLCTPKREDLVVGVLADGHGAITAKVDTPARRDFTLTPEAILVGRVVREDGTPVAGMTITASPAKDLLPEIAHPRITRSDATGTFRLTGLHRGPLALSALGPGHASRAVVRANVESGRTIDGIVVPVVSTHVVRGFVLSDRLPVVGVAVLAHQPGLTGVATSQADGSFAIDGVTEGRLGLDTWPHALEGPANVTVGSHDLEGIAVHVSVLSSIEGRVVSNGQPVANARVETEQRKATTRADGTFLLHDLRPGKVLVTASAGDAVSDDVTIDLAHREARRGVVLELLHGATIAGVVVDQDGKPIEGHKVVFELLTQTGRDYGRALTDASGHFKATQMTGGGRYRALVFGLDVMAPHFAAIDDKPIFVEVKDGTTHIEDLRLQMKYVTKPTGGRVVDATGAPIPNVSVIAAYQRPDGDRRLDPRWGGPSTTTDAAGSFVFPALQEGTYAVRAKAATDRIGTISGIQAGDRSLVITIQDPGRIAGTLVSFPTGTVGVSAYGKGDAENTFFHGTAQDQTFTFEGVPPGRYVVQASQGADMDAATVDVGAASATKVTLTNSGHGRIRGRVLSIPGRRLVEGATCSSITPGGWSGLTMDTAADGRFDLLAPAGQTGITCFSQTVSHGKTKVTLAANAEATVDVLVVEDNPGIPGYLGVTYAEQPANTLEKIHPDTPASRAGLRPGDTILAVDGEDVTPVLDYLSELIGRPPGTKLTLKLRRGRRTLTVPVTLGERPAE